ncbi:DUF6875 domain-containing protein [Actinokineospora sp. HUAS TT18]|uniref:DUF6875 domain-containing protein n=1 Tax=Actinokineospora sp. HUAS TT18 TaxID=3447451 RepID=UPI003F51E0E3
MLNTVVDRYPFEGGSLVDIDGAHELFERYPEYEAGLRWIREFVTQPDPRLNRPGAVCPRLAPAIRKNLLRLIVIRTARADVDEAWEKAGHLADLFLELFQRPEEFRTGSLLAFFPDIDRDGAAEFIDGGHRRLRMEFVGRGLMLGEFHKLSTVGSVRNADFPVMRSPVPMFAVRALTTHDILFLDQPATPEADRVRYLRHYLEHLGDQLSPDTRAEIERSISSPELVR